MNKFKVGDEVKYIGSFPKECYNKIGKIIEIGNGVGFYWIKFDDKILIKDPFSKDSAYKEYKRFGFHEGCLDLYTMDQTKRSLLDE